MQKTNKQIYYAGTLYDIVSEGDRILHLRSPRERNLIIKVPSNSTLLQSVENRNNENEIPKGKVS